MTSGYPGTAARVAPNKPVNQTGGSRCSPPAGYRQRSPALLSEVSQGPMLHSPGLFLRCL